MTCQDCGGPITDGIDWHGRCWPCFDRQRDVLEPDSPDNEADTQAAYEYDCQQAEYAAEELAARYN